MFMINPQDRTPIFSQLKKQIVDFIGLGILVEGDQLPSVRALAAELGINPNTVSKAYQELELQGYLHTMAGKGCFIAKAFTQENFKADKLKDVKKMFEECQRFKITKEELELLLNDVFQEEN